MGNGHVTTRQRDRTIAGVHLTRNDCGYRAQGLQIELVEDFPPYWHTVLADGTEVDGRTLERLIGTLLKSGHLVKDSER